MLCKLCNIKTADKKNAHIIPFVLLKTMVTSGESRRTDKDVAFDLSNPSIVNFYLGRELQPEKIHELLGRELSEKEKQDNSNPFVRNDFICTSCEEKFSRIESIFSSQIFPKIQKMIIDNKMYIILNEKESLLLKLFTYSIVWRIGAAKFGDYNLPELLVEKLRKIINQTLAITEEEILRNIEKLNQEIQKYKITISFFENSIVSDYKFVFFNPIKTNPYSFYITDFILHSFIKEKT